LRKALILPEEIEVRGTEVDELHPGRRKWTVSFSLPRGSYGTMLLKRLALKPGGG
jgi:tRNA pseudouridine13 synthase